MKRWEREGVAEIEDIRLPTKGQLEKGVAIIECIQEIPCNPCVDACPFNAISMENINALPIVDFEKCVGCGKCIEVCPGLAIFVVRVRGEKATVMLPYEFIPLPNEGQMVKTINREGKEICEAVVKKVRKGKTPVVTIELPAEYAMEARHIKVKGNKD
ncbi:MAG TPA: 4Fe-4S dicluster domain-containing protein [Thermoplasmatales archaeon]|nr:4Fe-4S dicluster domain-containing protein [Thermoplasmatales archaeon]